LSAFYCAKISPIDLRAGSKFLATVCRLRSQATDIGSDHHIQMVDRNGVRGSSPAHSTLFTQKRCRMHLQFEEFRRAGPVALYR